MGANYDTIVPQHIQRELQESARSESEALWLIADRALEVFNTYSIRKKAGESLFQEITDYDVWRAIAYFAGRGAGRVMTLVRVVQRIPIDCRSRYQEAWGFGYFEKLIHAPDVDAFEFFDFLEQYAAGEITHPLPGRVLGVGECLMIYETHIMGKVRGRDIPPEPGLMGVDLTALAQQRISFEGFYQHVRRLKRKLWVNRDKPTVCRVLELTEELEDILPEAMKEMGIRVSNTLDKTKESV